MSLLPAPPKDPCHTHAQIPHLSPPLPHLLYIRWFPGEKMATKRVLVAVLLLSFCAAAQEIPAQDRGSDALAEMLTRLRTTARLLHTTAHPDDDDGAMLAYESRGQGVETMMLTLNRGEGGQNKFGAALFDELGILRTLELLEADRYYGVEQRFTRVVDFGFSKTAAESFEKWGGHDIALADIVRVIRTFRPDVIVSRFDGTPRDGHGNHQAAGILSREAFRAAADPSRFPEQIREGLLPWQAKKLYIGNIRGEQNVSVRLNVGTYDWILGMSYAQFATEGLKHQMSQGVGGFYNPPGDLFRTYQLAETVLPRPAGEEKGFFDGIDETLPGLADRIGSAAQNFPWLRMGLKQADGLIFKAAAGFRAADPAPIATPLAQALQQVRSLISQLHDAQIAAVPKADVVHELRRKQGQLEAAINLALGATLQASVDAEHPQTFFGFFRQEETFLMAVPRQTFTVTARLYNRGGAPIEARDIQLSAPQGWQIEKLKSQLGQLGKNQQASAQFRVTVPADAPYTRPYWHRDDPQQSVYTIDDPQYATLALPPFPLHATATYGIGSVDGRINAPVQVKFVDPANGQSSRPLAVGPPLSVTMDPPVQVISTHDAARVHVTVGVRNDVNGPAKGTLRLQAPAGWRIEPGGDNVELSSEDEYKDFTFTATPPPLREGTYDLGAAFDYNGRAYSEGYKVIGRPDVGDFYYYRPARQRISAVDVTVPPNLSVGYIMGAGDEIPTVLQELGVAVHMITPGELATGELGHYRTIVVGIRAYDVRSDVRDLNRRLLQYVENGGTLLVQYQAATGVFNQGHYAPYPATLSHDRVTVEEAPVDILDPSSPLLRTPNPITQRDFNGWVQERGLYFMSSWDPHFKPLLASHDPGEAPLPGGLLVAPYGKGLYIYTGYAFFRQLPAGVPGAVRLFVNLLSAAGTQ
jgi:LmbE family N-acetylglucosaminyl deacetylase